MELKYRNLRLSEADKLHDIDRAEVIDEVYHFRNGRLVLEKEHYDMKGFPPGELEKITARQRILIENGGTVLAAFDGELLVGVASLENKFRGNTKRYMKMDLLHVSRKYRGRGIARVLIQKISGLARERGADALYISATPSKHTVEFYKSCGAKPVEELDAELYDMEPKDIHLELPL